MNGQNPVFPWTVGVLSVRVIAGACGAAGDVERAPELWEVRFRALDSLAEGRAWVMACDCSEAVRAFRDEFPDTFRKVEVRGVGMVSGSEGGAS